MAHREACKRSATEKNIQLQISGQALRTGATYDGDGERDPHEEVEATKDIVEGLFPILCPGWRDDVPTAGAQATLYGGGLETEARGR